MERTDDKELGGISVGDGSLAGPGLGGSVSGPDAGVIHDPVGAEVAAPIMTTPDEPEQPGDVSDDRITDTERPTGA